MRELLAQITAATGDLIKTAAGLTDHDVRRPSLLPGWSRGHVLTHVARNADGGTRLLTWARTGVESHEYPSMAARAEEIEAGSGRPAADLVADVRESASRFAEAYTKLAPDAWSHVVRWTAGHEHPASRAADARLTEVFIHHVDLAAGFTPADWPADFTSRQLKTVAAAFDRRPDTPGMRLHATDTDTTLTIGPSGPSGPSGPTITGPQHALLSWLLGRSAGETLDLQGEEVLPAPPFLY